MYINLHTSHPSAFISSTFTDLKAERDAVARELTRANLNINALDVKPASNDSSRKEILAGIKESDFVILIVGQRYGSMIQRMTLSKTLSITRWEYERAVKTYKKHVLVYFKKVESNDPNHYDDPKSSDYKIKRRLLNEFKNELSDKHNPKYFSTPDELADEVKKALIPTYRSGVKALFNINETLAKEVERLRQENEKLKGNISTSTETQQGFLAGGLSSLQPKNYLAALHDETKNKDSTRGLGLINYLALSQKEKK